MSAETAPKSPESTLPAPLPPERVARLAATKGWLAWAQERLGDGAWPALARHLGPTLKALDPGAPEPELLVGASALLVAHSNAQLGMFAMGSRLDGLEPRDECASAERFLRTARSAPLQIVRAAEVRLRQHLLQGRTTPEVLFLCAAFAWPLADPQPDLGAECWNYLVHAPWQTDAQLLARWVEALTGHVLPEGRRLLDLCAARSAAGYGSEAEELLEAVLMVESKRAPELWDESIQLKAQPAHPEAATALLQLAHARIADATDVRAATHALVRQAVRMHPGDGLLARGLDDRPWESSFTASLAAAPLFTEPQQVEARVAELLAAGQAAQARRLVEALLLTRLGSFVNFPGIDPQGRVVAMLGSLQAEFLRSATLPKGLEPPVLRAAVVQLASLYVRTDYATRATREFLAASLRQVQLAGEGAPLHPLRGDIERFINRTDPYQLWRQHQRKLEGLRAGFDDDHKAAADALSAFLEQRIRPGDLAVGDGLRTALDRTTLELEVPVQRLEQAIASALRTCLTRADRIDPGLALLHERGAALRSVGHDGARLLALARTETSGPRFEAASLGEAAGLLPLPPGTLPLSTVLARAWEVALRVAVLHGHAPRSASAWRLALAALSLAASSEQGEGLVAHLTNRVEPQRFETAVVEGVSYGAAPLATFLWSEGSKEDSSELDVRRASRLLALLLHRHGALREDDLQGPLLQGELSASLVGRVGEAACHLAMHESLLLERAA